MGGPATLEYAVLEQTAILIVDDQPDPLLLSERQLRSIGASRTAARSLAEATDVLGAWSRSSPTRRVVLVLDLMFPSDPNDGLDFLRAVSQRHIPRPDHTYVIVRTGVDGGEAKARAYALGAVAFVRKGDDHEELMMAVRFACGDEIRTNRTLCQVVNVDGERGVVRVAIEGRGGWYAERSFELHWCPAHARTVGGAFYCDTYKRLGARGPEVVIRSAEVDVAREASELAHLFRPL